MNVTLDREFPAVAVTAIQAVHYRSLKQTSQSLQPFQVLIGANASGKSTFLDVLAFFGDMLRGGLDAAVQGDVKFSIPQRAPDGRHLLWMREGSSFQLAIELRIPPDRRVPLKARDIDAGLCRYEIEVDVSGPLRLAAETLWLMPLGFGLSVHGDPGIFNLIREPGRIVSRPRHRAPRNCKKVLSRGDEPERVMFNSETTGWNNPFRLAADRAALTSLPADEERFPVATWLRQVLLEGVHRIALSSEAMRRPSPPGRLRAFLPDGSNLPWVVHDLEEHHTDRLAAWTAHVREALPALKSITTREREEDRHRYLVLTYENGLVAPSWLISDGTLRLLALTLLAYVPEPAGIYLIEEPENGIHPRAIETAFQSLSSVYGAQVLVATHSPVILGLAEASQVLCFHQTVEGATEIIQGNQHPNLQQWRGTLDLGTMFASGLLG